MSNKITDKILSIPPYISTYWSNVSALHMNGGFLSVTLVDGSTLQIPNLNQETLSLIFQQHAIFLEKAEQLPTHREERNDITKLYNMIDQGDSSIRFAFGSSMDDIGGMMQHNPKQSNSPDLPREILQKIGAIAKIISPSEEMDLPQAQEGCNCFFCQIARALGSESNPSHTVEELTVHDEELHFPDWNIQQIGEKLYTVINRLDEYEKYNVYLGEPIGCTCGKQGCEHILAVLKS